jgi:hypothetical protein
MIFSNISVKKSDQHVSWNNNEEEKQLLIMSLPIYLVCNLHITFLSLY